MLYSYSNEHITFIHLQDGELKVKLAELLMYTFGTEPLPKLRNYKLEEGTAQAKIGELGE